MNAIQIDGVQYAISKALISYRQTTQSVERDALKIYATEDVVRQLNAHLHSATVFDIQIPHHVLSLRYSNPLHFELLLDNDPSCLDVLFTRVSVIRSQTPDQ